jgi:hypothetical protein
MRPTIISLLALSLLGACAADGGLGQAAFTPECGPSDLTCVVEGLEAPLAVGATLPVRVDLELQGSAAPPLTLETVDPAVLTVAGDRLTGVSAGTCALLVLAPERRVLDFIHIWVSPPARAALHRWTADGRALGEVEGAVQLFLGDELILSPVLFSGFQRLSGSAAASWTVDAAVLATADPGIAGRRRFVAREAGQTRIQAEVLGMTAAVEVEVLP